VFGGQTAIVTGAGSGIGAAVVRALAARGARCVLAGRRRERLVAVAAEITVAGGLAEVVPTDVRDPAQVEALVARAAGAAGRVDILVNAAGVFRLAPLPETSIELFDETLAVNLRGAFLCCQSVWPLMQQAGGGQIVNISSVAGVEAYAGNSAYAASKFGLNGLTGVLALEGRPHNIRVLALCPAAADTEAWAGQAPEAVRRRMMAAEPLGELVAWLLATPRGWQIDPIVVRNFDDPWEGGG
jgi:3-oxoacyl-[acyl-carrier protein] reductase